MTAGRTVLAMLAAAASPAAAQTAATPSPTATETIRSRGNPILSDGTSYSTDPAPLVDGDTLYILAGRDEAPPGVNDFIMNEWQLLATTDPASGIWTHYPAIARPAAVFGWAEPGRAYAGQIVRAADGRFYLYAAVMQRGGGAADRFAIGVAVAGSPAGPWRDAHPGGPIVSQTVPVANDIQNIDPTVLIDDDGRVYLYWGTFGALRGMELARDMVTPIGPERRIEGLTGFFEAPWIMKRRGTYYMLYAANDAGPDSACTPAIYHACQAYGTAPAPMGPWTRRGVVLPPVSSTTSHAGAAAFRGQWYLTYHTADAVGGGHFRRSVAIDRLDWDDSVSPPAIRPVVPTRAPQPTPAPTRNVAPAAVATASNEPVPVQYWIRALNDGIVRAAPLPPDMWSSWSSRGTPARSWIEYRWPAPVTIDASRLRFFADRATGGRIAVPAAWHLEYWRDGWRRIAARDTLAADGFRERRFAPVRTRCLRAVFDAATIGGMPAGVGVAEWEVLAPAAAAARPRPARLPPPCAGEKP